MFLGHSGLEVGRGHVIGTALVLSPLHKQAIGQASIHAEDEHGFRILYAATVVVVGNIESLMEPALHKGVSSEWRLDKGQDFRGLPFQ